MILIIYDFINLFWINHFTLTLTVALNVSMHLLILLDSDSVNNDKKIYSEIYVNLQLFNVIKWFDINSYAADRWWSNSITVLGFLMNESMSWC